MENSSEYRRGRSVVYALHAHLVFVAKYRRKVFDLEHYEEMKTIFAHVCESAGAELIEINGEFNHVHILIHYAPTLYLPSWSTTSRGCLRVYSGPSTQILSGIAKVLLSGPKLKYCCQERFQYFSIIP